MDQKAQQLRKLLLSNECLDTARIAAALQMTEEEAASYLEQLRAKGAVMRCANGDFAGTLEFDFFEEERVFAPLKFEPCPDVFDVRNFDDLRRYPACAEVIDFIERTPPRPSSEVEEQARARGYQLGDVEETDQEEWSFRESLQGAFRYSPEIFFARSEHGICVRQSLVRVLIGGVTERITSAEKEQPCLHTTWGNAEICLADWATMDFAVILFSRLFAAGPQRGTFAEALFDAYAMGAWPCGLTAPYPAGKLIVSVMPHCNGPWGCPWEVRRRH